MTRTQRLEQAFGLAGADIKRAAARLLALERSSWLLPAAPAPTVAWDFVRTGNEQYLFPTVGGGVRFVRGRSSTSDPVYEPIWTAQGLYSDGVTKGLELDPSGDTRLESAEATWLVAFNTDELRDGILFSVRDALSLRTLASGGVRLDMRRPANTYLSVTRTGLVAQKWVVAGLRKSNTLGAKVWLDDSTLANTGETGAIGYNGTNIRSSLIVHANRGTVFKGAVAGVYFYNRALSDEDYAKAKTRLIAEVARKHGVTVGTTGAASTTVLPPT